jgi:hypothetical protein
MMRPHQPPADNLEVPSHGLKLYSIRIKGHLGPTSLAAFPEMTVQEQGNDCLLIGRLPDPAALFGVVALIEALGLELVEIRRLAPNSDGRDHAAS